MGFKTSQSTRKMNAGTVSGNIGAAGAVRWKAIGGQGVTI